MPGKTSLKKISAFARQYLFDRSLPHGIINWRYLLPRPSPKIRLHRRLWLLNRPRRVPVFLFFLTEAILWLRWTCFACWRRSWRMVQFRGPAIAGQEGIGRLTQLRRVLSMSLGHCIAPAEIYAFGLYRTEDKRGVWDYIFFHELPAFHQWRNGGPDAGRFSNDLLQDKYETSLLLSAQGVPTAPLLDLVPRNTLIDPENYLQMNPRIFCKPRHGSRSRNTYIAEADAPESTPEVFAVTKGIKSRMATLQDLREALKEDDFIVQPLLRNHSQLAVLGDQEDVITLRLITENHHTKGLVCTSATIEIPRRSDREYFHLILPVDRETGRLLAHPDRVFPDTIQKEYDTLLKKKDGFILPFWPEISKSAIRAHHSFPDIYAIAWDYVVTQEGPYLLEGNTGWGTATPQILHGGLLSDQKEENT